MPGGIFSAPLPPRETGSILGCCPGNGCGAKQKQSWGIAPGMAVEQNCCLGAFWGPFVCVCREDAHTKSRDNRLIQLEEVFHAFSFFSSPTTNLYHLSGPISRDTAILSLRYPISRDAFSGRLALPQNGAIPPLIT